MPTLRGAPQRRAAPTVNAEDFYQQVGGHDTFVRLVDEFYRGVADDDLLRPMYPEQDLGPARERLLLFLEQYWGGPTTYSDTRGHPRLRMRHAAFGVTPAARDRWLLHMRNAVDELSLAPLHEQVLWDYLTRAAHAMVNTFEQQQPTPDFTMQRHHQNILLRPAETDTGE